MARSKLIEKKSSKVDTNNNPFIARTGNERMKVAQCMKIPKMLCGELIFETSVVMLFAETTMGKSLFGFQLADAISRGKSIGYLENESEAQNVLYLDLENGEKVFERRYSEVEKFDGKETWHNPYDWSDNLKVVDLADPNQYQIPKENVVDWWFEHIVHLAKENSAKVVFIDNLNALIMEGGIEKSREVAPLLRKLFDLRRTEGYTFIVIHHTPKINQGQRASRNEMSGASNLSNLVDGIFTIRRSVYNEDESSRYIIQLKPTRYSQNVYHAGNVITSRICQIYPNFIGFELIELGDDEVEFRSEDAHLSRRGMESTKIITEDETKKRRELLKEYRKENPNTPKTELAKHFEVSRQTIYNDMNWLDENNGELLNNN